MPHSKRKSSNARPNSSRDRQPRNEYNVLEPRVLLAGDLNPAASLDGVWTPITSESISQPGDRIHVQAQHVELFALNDKQLGASLGEAPLEFTRDAVANPIFVSLPTPDDAWQKFSVVESPIMEPGLAAKFPGIKTYSGQGVDDPSVKVRFDFSHRGLHASVMAPNGGDYYIDPYYHLETSVYASYYVHDALAQPGSTFVELDVLDDDHDHNDGHDHDSGKESDHEHSTDGGVSRLNAGDSFGGELRTFRAAVATTGEYSQFHGGTTEDTMAAVVTAMNRVNSIYETDVAVRMLLVENNDQLIYLDAASDPYSNLNGFAMLGENQANVDAVIGSSNYDIGHVFSTGGGGVASLGSVGVNGRKAQGVTGLPSPIGDPFYVDFVAHEMGHQYAGSHTFNGANGACGGAWSGNASFEPGSGTTIQAYAGICGSDDLQLNSDPMFHSFSIDQIREHVTTGAGGAAATIIDTTNSAPTVEAGPSYVIPAGTPFELSAIGSDADGNSSLTYSWEQRDLGPQQAVNAGDNGASPLFRTFDPTASPTRAFPTINSVLTNTTVVGETLPTTDRTMNFRVVVRDNAAGGGGVAVDDTTVDVNPTGTPFMLTSQNTAETWTSGTTQSITWDVAGTTANGIDTPNVDIYLSIDGGLTFGTLLAEGVANNGTTLVVIPNTSTTSARIKIKGSGNIFFDINDADLTIEPNAPIVPGVTLAESSGSTTVAEGGLNDSYTISLDSIPFGTVTVSASADDQTELSLDGVNFSSSVEVAISGTDPATVFVQAIDDLNVEGLHTSTITHEVTSTTDPTNYPDSLVLGSINAEVIDNESGDSVVVVGVDFDRNNGISPSTWLTVNGGSNGTFNDLLGEDGVVSSIDLTIAQASGTWQDFGVTADPSTVPRHSQLLQNVDGQIYSGGESFVLTYSDLIPLQNYELYVLGLEGFYAAISQRVTIQGDGAEITFDQFFDRSQLNINGQIGDSAESLGDYAQLVTADTNGNIVITVDAINRSPDVSLAGIAISAISEAPCFDHLEIPLGATGSGIAISDGARGSGYIMYSADNVSTRFSAYRNNAEHLIAVRLAGSQWQYNDNFQWTNFSPVSSDRLLAEVDFTNDEVSRMVDSETTINGVNAGYSSGDLLFEANVWAGGFNRGEIGVSGNFFIVGGEFGIEAVGKTGNGVAVSDDATGQGYLLYSRPEFSSRFSTYQGSAENLVAVRNEDGRWQYNTNFAWIDFAPAESDRLLAELDFSNDTVMMLHGTSSIVNGIQSGYSGGDVEVVPNVWKGSFNRGEFGVTGSIFQSEGQLLFRATGDLNRGVAVSDNASGMGYLMYSSENVVSRFGTRHDAATNIVAVRLVGDQWQANDNTAWTNFTPAGSDRLLALANFTADTVESFEGTTTAIGGIDAGYIYGNLEFTPNLWNNAFNFGEFGVAGSFFSLDSSSPCNDGMMRSSYAGGGSDVGTSPISPSPAPALADLQQDEFWKLKTVNDSSISIQPRFAYQPLQTNYALVSSSDLVSSDRIRSLKVSTSDMENDLDKAFEELGFGNGQLLADLRSL